VLYTGISLASGIRNSLENNFIFLKKVIDKCYNALYNIGVKTRRNKKWKK
jgi:hypothetical protein